MSRSIHTTRRTLDDLRKADFSSFVEKAATLAKAQVALDKKRLAKSQVHAERRRPSVEPERSGVEAAAAVPIQVLDYGDFIHHSASEADIRAILAGLPPAALEGIAEVRLCLKRESSGRARIKVQTPAEVFEGTESVQILPGVLVSQVLGTYHDEKALITLHAYACDPSQFVLPRELCELYLRLRALKTLVHEVAHHHDHLCRTARGRWRMDREENYEPYAEKMEHAWTIDVVLPYLQQAYAKEVTALLDWVEHHGGLRLSLEEIAGDPRVTRRNGMIRLASSIFEGWVDDLSSGVSLHDSRLAFAWNLHYADRYDECLVLLDALLAAAPDDLKVLDARSDTLVHLERYDEALADAARVVQSRPEHNDGWENQGDAYIGLQQWHNVLANCDRWEQSAKLDTLHTRELLTQRATAHCALGDDIAMEACLQASLATFGKRDADFLARRRLSFLRRIHNGAGKPLPPHFTPPP